MINLYKLTMLELSELDYVSIAWLGQPCKTTHTNNHVGALAVELEPYNWNTLDGVDGYYVTHLE